MKNFKSKMKKVSQVVSITCDVCKKDYKDIFDLQEFLSYNDTCGYSSIFGDMNRKEIDICQHCQKDLLGKYMRIYGDIFEQVLHER